MTVTGLAAKSRKNQSEEQLLSLLLRVRSLLCSWMTFWVQWSRPEQSNCKPYYSDWTRKGRPCLHATLSWALYVLRQECRGKKSNQNLLKFLLLSLSTSSCNLLCKIALSVIEIHCFSPAWTFVYVWTKSPLRRVMCLRQMLILWTGCFQ